LSKTAHWLPVAPVPKVHGEGFVATSGLVVFSKPSTPGVGNWEYPVKCMKANRINKVIFFIKINN
jgi:hypothetical protein